jgi:hypothetical protein
MIRARRPNRKQTRRGNAGMNSKSVDMVMALAVMEAMRIRFACQHASGTRTILELQAAFRGMLEQMQSTVGVVRALQVRNAELSRACCNLLATHPVFLFARCSQMRREAADPVQTLKGFMS